jgi:uncharacterized membrane protein (UPF0127 family)
MRIFVFRTVADKARGLQYRPFIEDDTLFVFHDISSGDIFHSQNVPEPFDIAFLDEDGEILISAQMMPPHDIIEAPSGTTHAVESKAGRLARWGFVPGNRIAVV